MFARLIRTPRLAAAVFALSAVVTCSAVLAARQPQGSQQQQPTATFRTRVDVVQVDAVVLDSQGRFVSDLRQDEFEVLENGKPQQLATMQVVNIPVERADVPLFANRPVEPDVRTNERPFDGRVYLIVLDDLHTDVARSAIAKRLAKEFIERNVAVNDLAAVVYTSGNRKTSQEFTSNRQLLLRAVDPFLGRKVMSPGLSNLAMGGSSAADSVSAATVSGGTASPQAATSERIFNARSSLQTLSDLVSFAGRIRDRRKAVILIGEGIDYLYGQMGEAQTRSENSNLGFVNQQDPTRELRERLKTVIDAANRGNVTLYAFDPRVYTQGGDDMVDIASGMPDDMSKFEGDNVRTTQVLNDIRNSQDNLRTLATETGGFAVTGSKMALDKGFERVRVETSNYYILGYYASNDARDGKFRKIEVRVKRPGLRVDARKGYTAPKGNAPTVAATVDAKEGTSPAVKEALLATLPVSGFTLRATAAPFKGTGQTASVAVVVQTPGSDLKFNPQGDRFTDSVELSVVAVDKTGKTRGGERFSLDMPLTARMQSFVSQAGLVFQVRVPVPPGSYQLRIAGRDAGTDKVGSVHLDLDVPDFTATPLSMSGVVLTAEQAGQVPNPRPDQELAKLLPGTPIATREFSPGDVITLFTEVYDNKASQAHKVLLTTTVQGDDGRVLFKQEDERSSSEIQGARGGFGYVASAPLKGFAPGRYLLTVTARSTLDPSATVTRDVPFRVK